MTSLVARASRLTLVLALALLIPAATAAADRINLDFETGPGLGTPINTDYLQSGFVVFPRDPGFQPVRADVGNHAHSGHIVLDAGAHLCIDENYTDCEFTKASTTAQLTKTASAITMFVGQIEMTSNPETADLVAHRANGTDIDSGPVAISTTGITKPISVTSPQADIVGFTLTASEGQLAFDDLTLDFPNNSLADISPTTTNQVVPVLSGGTTPVPIHIARLNGSRGAVRVSAANLPQGVSAPAVTTSTDSATLNLVGAPNAPDTDFHPTRATITADPMHNASVASVPRTTTLDVRVANPYGLELAPGTLSDVALPACSPVDLPLKLPRDIGLTDTIHLSVTGLPAGVSADFLPTPDVAPGGGLTADRTLRLTRTQRAPLPEDIKIIAHAAEGDRTLTLHLGTATPTATVAPGFGLTPRIGSAVGTEIRVSGNGFCPGTKVNVGNFVASTDATLIDNHTLSFHVPALATSGNVTIVPSEGDFGFDSSNALQIDSFRNTDGFQFANFGFDGLSLGELADAFGNDDVFVSVNPCGFFGDCTIVTPIPNPVAAVEWPIISKALSSGNGHCFGISRAVQEFLAGHKSLRVFTAGGSVFSIPTAAHPHTDIAHFLDAQHALQASSEFLDAWFVRLKSVRGELARLHTAIARRDYPIVTLQHGSLGHAVLAYNVVDNSDGTSDVYVYDSNRPFVPAEDANGGFHADRVGASVIHMDANRGAWSFRMADGSTWGGGDGGTIYVAPESTIPQNPSLPGLSTVGVALTYLVFGSADGSVRTTGPSAGAAYLPTLDPHAIPGAGGTMMARNRSIAGTFVARRRGHYNAAVMSHGFAASASNVVTKPGVRDVLSGNGRSVSFDGGMPRPLTLQLGEQSQTASGTAWSATLQTHAEAGHPDSASLSKTGSLTYAHAGGASTVTFTLSQRRAGASPTTFASGPVQLGARARLSVSPDARLGSVRLTVRAGGRTRTMTLRNRVAPAGVLQLSKPRPAGSRVSLRVKVLALRTNAVMGVALRLVRRGHTVLTRALSVNHVRNGSRTITFTLPHNPSGRYRALTNVELIPASSSAARAVTAGSQAPVKLGG